MTNINQKKIKFFLYLVNNLFIVFYKFFCNFFKLAFLLLPIFYYFYSNKMFKEVFVNSSIEKVLHLIVVSIYKKSWVAKLHWIFENFEIILVILLINTSNVFFTEFVQYSLIILSKIIKRYK